MDSLGCEGIWKPHNSIFSKYQALCSWNAAEFKKGFWIDHIHCEWLEIHASGNKSL